LTVVVDAGPLVAALNRRDRAHSLSLALLGGLGRDALIPEPVLVEVDYLVRERVGTVPARAFLSAVVSGEHAVQYTSPGLLRRATEIDTQFADLNLGLTDACVMAVAERERLPVLTYDFEHFRATRPERGFWRLVIDERQYEEATS
jgi:predicted nucleic acid-binding protein